MPKRQVDKVVAALHQIDVKIAALEAYRATLLRQCPELSAAAAVPSSPAQALEALEFSHGAILDAIGMEDGLDSAAGEKVLRMIRAALTANGRIPPDWPGEDQAVDPLPIWTANQPSSPVPEFLRRLRMGDSIVSSDGCSRLEIAAAQACGRFLTIDGLGYIYRPVAAVLDASEAYAYFSRLFALIAPQCQPLPTLTGLATQFDNYIAGLLALPPSSPSRGQPDTLREGSRMVEPIR